MRRISGYEYTCTIIRRGRGWAGINDNNVIFEYCRARLKLLIAYTVYPGVHNAEREGVLFLFSHYGLLQYSIDSWYTVLP